MHPRRISTVCLVAACSLVLLGLFLLLANPTVDISASDGGSGPAGNVECGIAPWDAGLNDNRDGPGGEHDRTYFDKVAAKCYSANTRRFNAAVGSGVLALLMLSVGAVVLIRSTRKGRVPQGQPRLLA